MQESKISEALDRASFKDNEVTASARDNLTSRHTIETEDFASSHKQVPVARLPRIKYVRKKSNEKVKPLKESDQDKA